MKPYCSNKNCQAMTLVEVLVVIFVLFILAAMLLPSGGNHRYAPRINCVNNLHQIGLAYRSWANDHNDKFPMEISVTNGGTMELVANGKNAWLNFLVMSNELSTPKILYCTVDADHVSAARFSSDIKNNVSYFVGLDADLTNPQMLLSGDDNFEINDVPVKSGLLKLSTNHSTAWTAARHKFAGNIGLADGSAEQLNNSGLTNLLYQTGFATNRLAIP